MSKTITLDYKEYESMQDEIKKLKEQNSMLCQGASVVEVIDFQFAPLNLSFPYSDERIAMRAINDAEELLYVCEKIVAKGAENNIYFSGIETLKLKLKCQSEILKRKMDLFQEKKGTPNSIFGFFQ